MTYREKCRKGSNNPKNTNKNVCALAVAKALGVHSVTRYLHNWDDMIRAVRSRYTCRSRMTLAKAKGKSVGAIRANLSRISSQEAQVVIGYVVCVEGHVILLGADGSTQVDTDARKRDRRKVKKLYIILK